MTEGAVIGRQRTPLGKAPDEDYGSEPIPKSRYTSPCFSIKSGFVRGVWTPVPEPGTAVLMGLGLLGLSVRKRREA